MFKVISKSALHHLVSFSLSHPLFCSLHVPLTLCFSFCNVLALFHLPQLYIFAAVKIKIIFESFFMITFINCVTNILFHIYSFKYPLSLSLSLSLSLIISSSHAHVLFFSVLCFFISLSLYLHSYHLSLSLSIYQSPCLFLYLFICLSSSE